MQSKTIKIIILSIISIIIITGIIIIILSSLNFEIKGSTFAGFMLVLVGSILMFELKRFENILYNLINNLIFSIKKEEKIHLYFFLIIFISGIIFRIIYITKPINYNEAFIYLNYLDNKSFQQLFYYTSPNNFILNNIFIKLLFSISNKELWVLRIPSLMAGIFLIPAIYMMTRSFYNKFAAIIASSIIASSPLFIYYSADLQGISMMLLLFLILLLVANYLRRNDDIIVWIFAAIISSLGFFTSFIFFIPFISVVIWLFISAIPRNAVFNLWFTIKRILLFLVCTLMLTFLLYMPVAMSSGLANTVNYNYKNPGMIKALNAFLYSFSSYLTIGNKSLNIILLVTVIIFIICSLIFNIKNKKNKISIFYAICSTILIFLLCGIIFPFNEILPFIMSVVIITASFGISYLLNLIYLSIKFNHIEKRFNYFSIILCSLILIGIFFSGFFSNYNYILNSRDTFIDGNVIVKDFKEIYDSKNKLVSQKPSDFIMLYYINKNGIKYSDSAENYFPDKNIIVVVNKSYGQKLDSVLKSYYSTENLKSFGYKGPLLLKDYGNSAIYEYANLYSSENIIFDINDSSNKNQIEMKDFSFSETSVDKEIVMNDSSKKTLKYLKIPINLNGATDYLISFSIIKNAKLDNKIFIDFFGANYDNPDQEFSIDPDKISGSDFIKIRRVINSGDINKTKEIFFRIFSQSSGQFIIKDLKIYKSSN